MCRLRSTERMLASVAWCHLAGSRYARRLGQIRRPVGRARHRAGAIDTLSLSRAAGRKELVTRNTRFLVKAPDSNHSMRLGVDMVEAAVEAGHKGEYACKA